MIVVVVFGSLSIQRWNRRYLKIFAAIQEQAEAEADADRKNRKIVSCSNEDEPYVATSWPKNKVRERKKKRGGF